MTSKPDDDPLATGGGIGLFQSLSAEEDARFIGRIIGDYRIVELIGQGGMSRVFRAERADGSFERDLAIKVSATGGFNEHTRRQFALEQDLLAGLNHPGISQLYDAHLTDEGWPYIVMELVDGVSVTGFVEQHNLSARERVRLLADIVGAVAYAHGRPVTLPASAASRLPREIRLIVEQCLRPVADERYPDANALQNDLRAWLTDYPVAAAGQGAGYRFRKLIARNKPAAAIAAVAVLSLTTGVSWYTWQLSVARTEANEQADTALEEFDAALAMYRRLFENDVTRLPDVGFGRAEALVALGRVEQAAGLMAAAD